MDFVAMQANTRVITGDPAQCREPIAYLREALGVTDLSFVFAHVGLSHDEILCSMDRWATRVLGAGHR